MSGAGKKALATLGRRGAAVSNARRWANKDSDLAQKSLRPLEKANQERHWTSEALEAQVKSTILLVRVQTGRDPSTRELASEFDVSVGRVKQIRQKLSLQARRGRPKKG